jgi:hypothetical protein
MRSALRIGIASALVAVSAGVPWVLQHQAQLELRARRDTLEQQAGRLSLLAQENGRLSNLISRAEASPALTTEQLHELLRLRNEKRWLADQTKLLATLAGGTSDLAQRSPAELETTLSTEMTEAMKRILPTLPPALQKYALAHSNQPPVDFSDLQDYFPLFDGRKMVGLQTFEFAREGGPRPGDALILRGDVGRRPGDDNEVRVYGFSDGRVVEVAAEDGRFEDWETQHLTSAPAGTEEKFHLEAEETAQERARVAEVGALVGISAEDAGRFFDRVKQRQKFLGPKLAEMEKSLTGSPEEKQRQKQAAVEAELNKLAIETLGDKGPALVQRMGVLK